MSLDNIDGKILQAVLKRNVVVGVAADTNMAISGIKKADDKIISAVAYRAPGYAPSLKSNVVAGTTADTNIAISGIATTDKIVRILAVKTDAAAASGVLDLTAEGVILSAGNIQLTDTDTTGHLLIVEWIDVSVQAADLIVVTDLAITSDGNIQSADTNLTGYLVDVLWWDESAEQAGVDD